MNAKDRGIRQEIALPVPLAHAFLQKRAWAVVDWDSMVRDCSKPIRANTDTKNSTYHSALPGEQNVQTREPRCRGRRTY